MHIRQYRHKKSKVKLYDNTLLADKHEYFLIKSAHTVLLNEFDYYFSNVSHFEYLYS
jgi:hypothetical protein